MGIDGIDHLGKPQQVRAVRTRVERLTTERPPAAGDGLRISEEAREAAKAARLASLAGEAAGASEDRIARARSSIEQGLYRRQDVVEHVAERLGDLLG